ncbi:G patch domain-containing protein 4 [Boothiomyces sp. JEL0866]|nr:G patch domain-containing protein 4 [Boothiomyces sp. JEL0866]
MAAKETFAERQLKKYGWKKGQGLGKNNEGISKAISVGVKNDTDGVPSSTIKIAGTEDSIQIEKEESKEKEKKLLYGAFVKAGDAKEEKKDYSIKVTDEELFRACEGRTARKGARGEQNGKLSRAELADKVREIKTKTKVKKSKKEKKKKEKKSKKSKKE